MANQLMASYKEYLLQHLLTDTIKFVLVDTNDYTFVSTHDFLDDIPIGARVATSEALTAKDVTNGVFGAGTNPKFPLATGDPSEAMFLYVDSGVDSTSRLIGYIDTAAGLPITPDGSDIGIDVSNDIFNL